MEHTRLIGLRLFLTAAALIVICAGLKSAQTIIIPILLGLFFAIISTPLVVWLKKIGVPKIVAVLIASIILLTFFVLFGFITTNSLNRLISLFPQYSVDINNRLTELSNKLISWGVNLNGDSLIGSLSPSGIFDLVRQGVGKIAQTLSSALLVFIITIFILFEAASFQEKIQVALPNGSVNQNLVNIRVDVQRYLGIKTLTSVLTGVIIWLFTMTMGLELAILWGIIAFLFNFIPFIGSIVASVPAITIALVQMGMGGAIVVAIGYIVVNISISNFLEPVFMGRKLGLSPLIVFISLLFWGWMWGPMGMILSIPLTMVLKILLEHSQELQWVAVLMGDKAIKDS